MPWVFSFPPTTSPLNVGIAIVDEMRPAIQMGMVGALISTLSWSDLVAIAAHKIHPILRIGGIVLLRLLIVLPPVIAAGMIARFTRPNAHCDEYVHIDAFEYFRTHWLRPPIGSNEVLYSVNGISRTFNGEIVYLIYGKAAYWPRRIWPEVNPYYIYRGCNIAILLLTLGVLVSVRCRWFPPWLLALFLACIPQVIYTYAYANSDAFGVSASILLFVQTARMLEQSPREWSALRIGTFMLLFLLTLLSKIAFEMDILLPLALLIIYFFRAKPSLKWIALRLGLPLLLVYAAASWWNPMLSPIHATWQKQMMALREQKAIPGRRPNDPQPPFGGDYPTNFAGSYLAANHGTYHQIFTADHGAWLPYNGESFYGRFAYMLVILPTWIYATVAYTAIALTLLTLAALWACNRRISWPVIFCIVLAPPLIALNLYGSLYHSFHYDWQPQGRYLFASLVPLFFLCFGTWAYEGKWWRLIHSLVLVLLMPLSLYVLVEYVALNPFLR